MIKSEEIVTMFKMFGYEVLSDYNGMENPMSVKHLDCNTTYNAIPKTFKRNNTHGFCPTCYPSKRMTAERYQRNIDKIHGTGEYKVLEFSGVSVGKISKVIHITCGNIWTLKSPQVIYKSGCPSCYGNKIYTIASLMKEISELTNGEYSVIDDVYISEDVPILMRHNTCKHQWKVRRRNFINRGTRCPVCVASARRSKSEELFEKTLIRENIKFKNEVRFKNLISSKGKSLLIDFYIPEYKIVIELDGEQHFFKRRDGEDGTRLRLAKQRDQLKNEYFDNSDTKLIRIPYTVSLRDVCKIGKEIALGGDLSSTTIERYNLYDSTNSASVLNYYTNINKSYYTE